MAGLCASDLGVAPDLHCKVEERNNDADSGNDLREVGEIAEGH